MKFSVKHKISSFLRELSIVCIGVTIAFIISSKHDKYKQDVLKTNVLATIVSEQIENIERIELSLKLNKEMLTNYDSIIKFIEHPSIGEHNSTVTVGKCIFNDTGYDLAIQSRVLSTLPFTIFKDISWCYKLQVSTTELQSSYINYLGSNIIERDAQFYKAAKNKLQDVNRAFEMLKTDLKDLIENINTS